MRVGAALRPLDVPAGTPLGGYADRIAPAGGRLDELTVAAVAVEAGDGLFVLVVAELVCVNEDLVADVAAAVTARLDRTGVTVWTAATHTHSGPDVNCGTGDRVTPPQWRRAVAAGAADAAEEAARETHPGRLAWRGGVVHGVAAIRSVGWPECTTRLRMSQRVSARWCKAYRKPASPTEKHARYGGCSMRWTR